MVLHRIHMGTFARTIIGIKCVHLHSDTLTTVPTLGTLPLRSPMDDRLSWSTHSGCIPAFSKRTLTQGGLSDCGMSQKAMAREHIAMRPTNASRALRAHLRAWISRAWERR